MWHLKTKYGTFWLVKGHVKEYHLGVNDVSLGIYRNAKDAIKDVSEQNTGHFYWDCQSKVSIPKEISLWAKGEPIDWE